MTSSLVSMATISFVKLRVSRSNSYRGNLPKVKFTDFTVEFTVRKVKFRFHKHFSPLVTDKRAIKLASTKRRKLKIIAKVKKLLKTTTLSKRPQMAA